MADKTSWIVAFHIGDIDIAGSLLRHGTDVNALDCEGQNPLHRASDSGRADIVWLLLKHNVDVDLPTEMDVTPISKSVKLKPGFFLAYFFSSCH